MANSSVAVTAGSGTDIDTRTDPDGNHRQVVVLGDADAATTAAIGASGLVTAPAIPATATRTNVTASTTDTQLLAATAGRRAFRVWNDSTADLYLGLGTTTVTVASYTVKIAGGGFYFDEFAGQVRGMWSAAVGTARLTELSA